MTRVSWPPSPCVEDEEVALAREHGSESSDTGCTHGKSPLVSRGSIDQQPLIIDANAREDSIPQPEISQKKQSEILANRKAQVEAEKSQQSQNVRENPRFDPVHSTASATLDVPSDYARPRSKSTTRMDGQETPRGRPQVHRLQTDFGGDLHAMASGQRRAPSPYAYRPPTKVHQSNPEQRPKPSLLSPETATAPRSNDGGARRSRSARPERANIAIESSDSDQKTSRHKHRSRSRHTRASDTKYSTSGADEYVSDRRPERRDSYRRTRPSPPRTHHSHTTHRSAHGNITPPETPSLPRESPYTSAAEDTDRRRRRDKSRVRERKYSKESPYTSNAEDGHRSQTLSVHPNGMPSRRGSMRRSQKPQLELSDNAHRGSFDSSAPPSSRTPKAFEDYFQKAFDDNRTRHTKHNTSAHPSPMSSPPTSPPRTPRGERRGGEYFELNAPASAAKQRSRPTSAENPIKLSSLLGAAVFGASQKATPPTPRSSNTSLETPLNGSQGSVNSEQRSRKPSPVQEDNHLISSRPGSRADSFIGREEPQSQRGSVSSHHDRPVSRAGSTTSRDDAGNNHRANPLPMRDDRPVSRNGIPIPNGSEHPPMAQRAASYSSYDHQRTRPSSRRTYSTNGSTTVMPASSYQQHLGPSHLSRTAYVAPPAVQAVANVAAPTATNPQRVLSFPVCPQPHPVTGSHNWYTIRGMQNFDICASCASVLGKSEFRDYCSPSWKPATEAVTCALSRPWIRVAIARALKDRSVNVALLQELNMLPPAIRSCPGKQSDARKWYHITDPNSRSPVPNFDVCTACVRSVELIFPELRDEKLFERPNDKLSQERVCNLNGGGKHFYAIFNEVEKLAIYTRQKDLRPRDISNFGNFVRQKTRYRECMKNAMLATTLWHYIPGIPEFTVCEECFNEVVWPMKDLPIAKDVIPTLQKVQISRPDRYVAGISCQLYSDRMRAIFKNACRSNDFEGFRRNAIQRYNIEHKLQEKQRALQQDEMAGIDRRAAMEQNIATWKSYE